MPTRTPVESVQCRIPRLRQRYQQQNIQKGRFIHSRQVLHVKRRGPCPKPPLLRPNIMSHDRTRHVGDVCRGQGCVAWRRRNPNTDNNYSVLRAS